LSLTSPCSRSRVLSRSRTGRPGVQARRDTRACPGAASSRPLRRGRCRLRSRR
jgi:hypothetical protein